MDVFLKFENFMTAFDNAFFPCRNKFLHPVKSYLQTTKKQDRLYDCNAVCICKVID